MRFNRIAAVGCLVRLVSATDSGGCHADNCLRAVKATAFPTRSANCEAFFLATVTPARSTVTVTVISTTLPTEQSSIVEDPAVPTTPVTVYPTAIPTYASACSGSVRYSSACSCVGASKSTTTVAAPSTTIYATECSLPSPTAEACGSLLSGSNSRQYQVECGVAYSGESSLSTVTAASYQDCFNACESDSACGAFTFDSAQCSNNCKLFGFYDSTTLDSSSTANSGFTPGTARDGSCGLGICGAAVLGGTTYQDSYLVACRSSYSFSQGSDVAGSPFTATSFLDCLRQCDDIYGCNYMSFDSSKFTGNCAMFSRGGVSSDILTKNPYVDSAKALVQTGGPPGIELLGDVSECPVYDSSQNCSNGPGKSPIHSTSFKYTAACGKSYAPTGPGSSSVVVSTLTVNSFAQCFDACDKNNHCLFMTFTSSSISSVDNCQFMTGSNRNVKPTVNPGYDSIFYPQ